MSAFAGGQKSSRSMLRRQRQFSGGTSAPMSRIGTDVSATCSLESWVWSLFASFQRLSSCAISRTLLPNGLNSGDEVIQRLTDPRVDANTGQVLSLGRPREATNTN